MSPHHVTVLHIALCQSVVYWLVFTVLQFVTRQHDVSSPLEFSHWGCLDWTYNAN